MQILDLKLLNFRNYDSLSLTFSPKCNLIYGLNGMGKTNLVEAIYVLALTRSFRGSVDNVLIAQGKNLAKIEGTVFNQEKSTYRIIISPEGKTVKIDGNKMAKISSYVSKICVVLFSPDDLRMIKDSPSVRRKMVDVEISQLNNSYIKYLNIYTKTLKQRNAYLKTVYVNANSPTEYLNILTMKLIDFGLQIYEIRRKFVKLISSYIQKAYEEITGDASLEFRYHSDYEGKTREELAKEYQNYFKKDMMLGKTNFGVHHDDYVFNFKGVNIKDFGSEGQQKNAIIAFKIAEINIFREEKGIDPILILDDLFSELDQEKLDNIMRMIDANIQTFITTTDIDKVEEKIKKTSKKFKVLNGQVEEIYE